MDRALGVESNIVVLDCSQKSVRDQSKKKSRSHSVTVQKDRGKKGGKPASVRGSPKNERPAGTAGRAGLEPSSSKDLHTASSDSCQLSILFQRSISYQAGKSAKLWRKRANLVIFSRVFSHLTEHLPEWSRVRAQHLSCYKSTGRRKLLPCMSPQNPLAGCCSSETL